MHSAGDLVMCFRDYSGHIGRNIDDFVGVHGGYCIGQKNFEGGILLEFCLGKELCVLHTWFMREENRKVTCKARNTVWK